MADELKDLPGHPLRLLDMGPMPGVAYLNETNIGQLPGDLAPDLNGNKWIHPAPDEQSRLPYQAEPSLERGEIEVSQERYRRPAACRVGPGRVRHPRRIGEPVIVFHWNQEFSRFH